MKARTRCNKSRYTSKKRATLTSCSWATDIANAPQLLGEVPGDNKWEQLIILLKIQPGALPQEC